MKSRGFAISVKRKMNAKSYLYAIDAGLPNIAVLTVNAYTGRVIKTFAIRLVQLHAKSNPRQASLGYKGRGGSEGRSDSFSL
jgi:hypothetical protein